MEKMTWKIIRKKYSLLLFALVVVIFFLVTLKIKYYTSQNNYLGTEKFSKASSTQAGLTTQADWEHEGAILSNINTSSSPGAITINNSAGSQIDLTEKTTTATCDEANKDKPIDLNESTCWTATNMLWPTGQSWTIDLGQEYMISKSRALSGNKLGTWMNIIYSYSLNGADFTLPADCIPLVGGWSECTMNASARYLKIDFAPQDPDLADDGYLYEFQAIEAGATAVHTTAATQITNTNLYQWQTFSPAYTEPENTDVKFRFRSSINSTDWTEWSDYQTPASGGSLDLTSIVTSKTGDPGSETFYKYIQVETTLTNTDGASTPTLDSYEIGYHSNVKPTTPTPGSVTIGS